MSFIKEEDIKLIEMVVKYRCLYDPADQDFKDLNLKNNYWMEIASHFKKKSYNECKKRWRTIRDTYKRLKKKGKLGNGTSKREWHLAPHLYFLESVADDPRNNNPVNENNSYENTTEEEPRYLETQLNIKTDLDNGSVETLSPSSSSADSQKSQRSDKRKWDDEIQTFLDKSQVEKQQLLEVINYLGNRNEDELDLFYKSISLSVKHLPPHLIVEAKTEHLQTLHRLQMQCLEQSQEDTQITKRNRPKVKQTKTKS